MGCPFNSCLSEGQANRGPVGLDGAQRGGPRWGLLSSARGPGSPGARHSNDFEVQEGLWGHTSHFPTLRFAEGSLHPPRGAARGTHHMAVPTTPGGTSPLTTVQSVSGLPLAFTVCVAGGFSLEIHAPVAGIPHWCKAEEQEASTCRARSPDTFQRPGLLLRLGQPRLQCGGQGCGGHGCWFAGAFSTWRPKKRQTPQMGQNSEQAKRDPPSSLECVVYFLFPS